MKMFPLGILALISFVSLTMTVMAQGSPRGHVDQYGDPLPKGAVKRLGTLRFVHPGLLATVAISHDGTLLATGGSSPERRGSHVSDNIRQRGTIRIWQTATGKLVREIVASRHPVCLLCFSPKGKTLVGVCRHEETLEPHSLSCWKVATGRRLWKTDLAGDTDVRKLEFTTSGAFVSYHVRLTTYIHGKLKEECSQPFCRVWDANTGKLLPQKELIHVPARQVNPNPGVFLESMARSADGRFTAVGLSKRTRTIAKLPNGKTDTQDKYFDKHVKIFDNRTGKVIREIRGFKSRCSRLALSDDGTYMAVDAGWTHWLICVKTGTKQLLGKAEMPIHKMMFLDSGNVFAVAGCQNYTMRFWDVPTGKQLANYYTAWYNKGHWEGAALPKHLLAIHSDHAVYFWNWKTGKEISKFPGHRKAPAGLCFNSANVLVSWNDKRNEWHWRTGKVTQTSEITYGQIEQSHTSRERNLRVTVRGRQTFEVRDLTSKKRVSLVQGNVNADSLSAMRFSSSGKTMLLVESRETGDTFHFFDLTTAKLLSKIQTTAHTWHNRHDQAFVFNDQLAALQAESGEVVVLKVRSGQIVHRWHPTKPGGKTAVPFAYMQLSANNQWLLATPRVLHGNRMNIFGWNLKTGKRILQTIDKDIPRDRDSRFFDTAFSPDGRLLALAKFDRNVIELREVVSGRVRTEVPGHLGAVRRVAFSPDGKHLASGSYDTTILIWDMEQVLQPSTPLKKRLTEKELVTHWTTLAGADAKKANIAIGSLVAAAEDSVPFLQKQLPLRTASPRQLQRWLADLDSKRYAVRVRAMRKLQQVGEPLVPALRTALSRKPTLEVHLRLTKLIEQLTSLGPTPSRLRQTRAVEVLERINNLASRRLLRTLAAGPGTAWLTMEARKWGG